MPFFLKEASRDIDLKIQDADDVTKDKPAEDTGYTSMNIQVKGVEGKKLISMNTNALESKINALQIIHNLAQNLGTSFFDYVEPVSQLLTTGGLMTYTYSRAVRKLAIKIVKHLLMATNDTN